MVCMMKITARRPRLSPVPHTRTRQPLPQPSLMEQTFPCLGSHSHSCNRNPKFWKLLHAHDTRTSLCMRIRLGFTKQV